MPTIAFTNPVQEELSAMISPSLAEEGCPGYQPHADPARPERMAIVEERPTPLHGIG